MPSEKPSMKLVSVICAAAAVVPNAAARDGRLGRYMSMESGPHAASAPSNRISRRSARRLMMSGMRGERELEEKARFPGLVGDDRQATSSETNTHTNAKNLATATSGVQANGLNKALKQWALYAPR